MKLTVEEINKKIEDHQHFLAEDVKNWCGMRGRVCCSDIPADHADIVQALPAERGGNS